MKFTAQDQLDTGDKIYTLIISQNDIMTIFLDDFDRALMEECDKSDKASDALLALEMMVRKIEEKKP